MRAAVLSCVAVLAVSTAVLLADDHSVIFDEEVDFSRFMTFTMSDARIDSARPELSFPLVVKTLSNTVRGAFVTKGLKDTSDRPELLIECSVKGVDYSIGPFGRPNAIMPGQARGGRSMQVDFTDATIVIDVDPPALIWRGVYHDTENDARKLAKALPKDATRLLAEYPPKKK